MRTDRTLREQVELLHLCPLLAVQLDTESRHPIVEQRPVLLLLRIRLEVGSLSQSPILKKLRRIRLLENRDIRVRGKSSRQRDVVDRQNIRSTRRRIHLKLVDPVQRVMGDRAVRDGRPRSSRAVTQDRVKVRPRQRQRSNTVNGRDEDLLDPDDRRSQRVRRSAGRQRLRSRSLVRLSLDTDLRVDLVNPILDFA